MLPKKENANHSNTIFKHENNICVSNIAKQYIQYEKIDYLYDSKKKNPPGIGSLTIPIDQPGGNLGSTVLQRKTGGFEKQSGVKVVDGIVCIGKSIGLGVDESVIKKLVEGH